MNASRARSRSSSPSQFPEDYTDTQMEHDLVSALDERNNTRQHFSLDLDEDKDKRPSKKRWVAFIDDQAEARRTWHWHVTNRKVCSLTQPGRGIRKIIDLFHNLPNLLDKAEKHAEIEDLEPDELEECDCSNFAGMTQEQIDEECQEYIIVMCVTWHD